MNSWTCKLSYFIVIFYNWKYYHLSNKPFASFFWFAKTVNLFFRSSDFSFRLSFFEILLNLVGTMVEGLDERGWDFGIGTSSNNLEGTFDSPTEESFSAATALDKALAAFFDFKVNFLFSRPISISKNFFCFGDFYRHGHRHLQITTESTDSNNLYFFQCCKTAPYQYHTRRDKNPYLSWILFSNLWAVKK